jgi:hypothetical protein
MKSILFVTLFVSMTLTSSLVGIEWIVKHYQDEETADPLTYIRERQRNMEVGKYYCVEYGAVVRLVKATDSGYDAESVFDLSADEKGVHIAYNKAGWAISPNDRNFDILRPLAESRQKSKNY